jgi:hypothetical protein
MAELDVDEAGVFRFEPFLADGRGSVLAALTNGQLALFSVYGEKNDEESAKTLNKATISRTKTSPQLSEGMLLNCANNPTTGKIICSDNLGKVDTTQ